METELITPEKETAAAAAEKKRAKPKFRKLNKYDVIEFYQKYGFKTLLIAIAAVCFISLGAAFIAVVGGSGENEDSSEPQSVSTAAVSSNHRTSFTEEGSGAYDMVLSWTEKEITLENHEAHAQIKAELNHGGADSKITWKSSNETIASVDDYGNIIAYGPGEVIIEASADNGSITKDARLTVIQPVTGIFMPVSTITLNVGGAPRLLRAQLTPEDASASRLRWKSGDASVAEVDDMGRVKPVGDGMTEITVSDIDNGVRAKCFVSVVNKSVNVETVAIQNKGNNIIALGDTINAVATVLPENAKNKTLVWSSDNDGIASVNSNGTITANGVGTAVITAASPDGAADSLLIEVRNALADNELDMGVGFLDGFGLLGETYASGGTTYTTYGLSVEEMTDIQMSIGGTPPQIWVGGGSTAASRDEVAEYVNPNNFYMDAYKYQFLDLSRPNGVSEDALNAFLENKGILRGQARTFIEAAKDFGISEVYLAAHACLESGNGTSKLATGVEVNGTVVYNMFGIAAYDTSALYSGSQYAYNAGWTSVEAAIRGGAEWISKWYINSENGRQNTLYKMKWNPENAISMESIFASFPEAVFSYDVPVYNGMIPPVIEN